MSRATLTINGLNSYVHNLFEFLTVPEGIDKETLIDNIILKSADLEVLYSDPEYMRLAIGVWSKKHARTFTKWLEALKLEYNPIENYDRIEEWTDTGRSTGNSNGSADSTIEDKRSAYDSNTYENSALNSNKSTTGNNFTNDNNNVHVGRVHGNIGVTTSSALLLEALDAATWNLYDHIADLFISEFCLLVY